MAKMKKEKRKAINKQVFFGRGHYLSKLAVTFQPLSRFGELIS
jgi:hypothetical protein